MIMAVIFVMNNISESQKKDKEIAILNLSLTILNLTFQPLPEQ